MSVIAKILTLLRGSARELGQSVVDANATTIYEQEIVDARNAILKAKGELTGVMAKEMQSARELEALKREITRLEGLAVEALNKSEEKLAEEVAAKIAEIETQFDEQTRAHASYALQVGNLKRLIKSAEDKVREHEREAAMARTTESVYTATRSISDNIGASGSKLVNARESLERIKQRHQDFADRVSAAESLEKETGTKALEQKLAEAGIGVDAGRAKKVLERLRASQSGSQGEA